MSRVGSRVEGLEAKRAKRSPTPAVSPEQALSTSILLKSQDAARRVLDGLEPEPSNELTLEEAAYERDEGRQRWWIDYLEAELSRAPPGAPMHDAIVQAIRLAKEDLQKGTA